jgi:CheY-like chemotaxis protein
MASDLVWPVIDWSTDSAQPARIAGPCARRGAFHFRSTAAFSSPRRQTDAGFWVLARLNRDGNLEVSRDVAHVTNNNRGDDELARGDHMEVDVLVIDDSDSSADLTLLAIRDAAPQAKIVRFHDATKALRFVFLAESTPKLVLLELGQPLHHGLHVIERLRSNTRLSAIPVIVLTATRDQSAAEASHALGANGFITKPDTREEYRSQVKAIVERWLH